MRAQVVALLVAGAAPPAEGHGALVIPPARNNYGNVDPAEMFRGGGREPRGEADAAPGVFTPGGGGGGCCAGGSCLWFSEGCFNGCANCTRLMPRGGNQINSPPADCTPTEPTLPEEFRTYNAHNQSANGDWTRYHPWRSPGKAPTSDPCGVAGAYLHPAGAAGDKPAGAHSQGDPGSKLPPLSGVKTEWTRDGVAEVGFMLGANHGGGYHYSLCPLEEELTEACFAATPLRFASSNSTVRYVTGRLPDQQIRARDVDVGTHPAGSTWRVNPIPACNCDNGGQTPLTSVPKGNGGVTGCVYDPTGSKKGTFSGAYENTGTGPDGGGWPGAENCSTGLQFPMPFDWGYGQQIWNRAANAGPAADDWAIVDTLRVPSRTGRYVLRWRWDTEQNPQIWTHCADVTIVE